MTEPTTTSAPMVLRDADGDRNSLGGVTDRFMVDGDLTQGRFALVQHLFEPRALAAPLHRHTREDEYTYVLRGRIGAVLGDTEVFAEPGDLVFKPRNQWHTFWNAGDEPAAVLELISTAGLEQLFRAFGDVDDMSPEVMAEMAAEYGCDLDFEGTFPIVERHRLEF